MAKPRYKNRKLKLKKRVVRRKKIKMFFRSRFFYDILLVVVLAASAGYLLFFSPLFKVNSVMVRGGVRGLSLIGQLGRNIFLIDSRKTEKQVLSRFPEIKRARLKKILPAGLVLIIEKRQPVGLWCPERQKPASCPEGNKDCGCFLIDSQAVVFKDQGFQPRDLVRIEPYRDRDRISPEYLGKVLIISRRFKQKLGLGIESFVWRRGGRLDLKTSQGWQVYFDLNQNINLALTKLFLLLEQEISPERLKQLEYIDLRFSKVYYK